MRGAPVTEVGHGLGLIGSYRLERILGRGGFGIVYAGVDTRLGRRAAIKQLLPKLSADREMVERFFNEAKAAAGIDHPGIVEIYDVGWQDDSAYFAMKLLDGDSLASRLGRGPLGVLHACTIARQVGSALAAAHARGIVHRDLKPDNIILVPDDEVAIGERAIVLDFGIAKLSGEQTVTHRTRTGMMMGTPTYMSPEQCRGSGEVDHRSDVYALGCILFEMLAGRPPFVSEAGGQVMGMHLFVEPPEISQLAPAIPAELAAAVMGALAKDPDRRPPNMTALLAALRPFAAGGVTERSRIRQVPVPPKPRKPRRRLLLIAGIAFGSTIAGATVVKLGLSREASAVSETTIVATPKVQVEARPAPPPPPQPTAFEKALTDRDLRAARLELDKLPQTDRAPALAKVNALEAALVDEVAAELKKLAASCSKHAAHLHEVERQHGTAVMAAARTRVPCIVAPPAPVAMDVPGLVKQAQQAQQRGDHVTALARAELALAKQPFHSFARSLAANAACRLGNLEKSATHISQLAGPAQRIAQDICTRNGVTVDIRSSSPLPRLLPPPQRPFDDD